MDKEKQIEELVGIMSQGFISYEDNYGMPTIGATEQVAKDICNANYLKINENEVIISKDNYETYKQVLAEWSIMQQENLGCRKVYKHEIVISKEEKQKLLKEMYEQGKFDAIADLEKEGKVVISKEEYERLSIFQFETAQQIMSETRKETAREYHYKMSKVIHERDYVEGYAEIGLQEENDEIAKEFDVEIGEEK